MGANGDAAVDLVDRQNFTRGTTEVLRDTGSIIEDALGFVLGTKAAIETCVQPLGDAAFAGEEAMADAGKV
jgi:hypothetical protein